MTRSTHIRRLATLAVIAGAMSVLAPVAQAEPILDVRERSTQDLTPSQPGYGVDRVSDSVEAARAARQRTELSFQSGYGVNRIADSVDAARAAQRRDVSGLTDLASSYRAFRSFESMAAPTVESQLKRPQPIDGGGFDWREFGIGAATGVALMLLLGALGARLVTRRQVRTA
jgi:hypothetical protein